MIISFSTQADGSKGFGVGAGVGMMGFIILLPARNRMNKPTIIPANIILHRLPELLYDGALPR
jgi:hypothetical protein